MGTSPARRTLGGEGVWHSPAPRARGGVPKRFLASYRPGLMTHELEKVVASPLHPRNVGSSSDWERVERDFRVSYPDDFKEINRRYGTGWFDGHIQVLGPKLRSE